MSEKMTIRCPKGHFYNGNLFDSCPHCADGLAEGPTEHVWGSGVSSTVKEEKHTTSKQRQGLSIWKKKEKLIEKEQEKVQAAKQGEKKTERMNVWEEEPAPQQKEENKPAESGNMGGGYVYQQAPVQENRSSLQAGLAQAARPVENLDEGKTVGYFHTNGHEEPPVGYLICTAGDDYGKGFLLKSGNNNVGRSSTMDVIVMDPKVSREKQLSVIYEPLKREFYVKPGDGSALTYCNDELVLGVRKLQSHDVIAVGDTKLMLIPVCSERFSWDE